MIPDKLRDFYESSPMREGILCWYPFDGSSSVLDLSGGILTKLLGDRCDSVLSADKTTCERAEGLFDYIVILDPNVFSVKALTILRSKLNPSGRLLLAYENPFALRYWAGKRATNTKRPYSSLFGGGKNPLPSKAELQTRLELAGFKVQKWYYPVPDHYFAADIYSDTCLPNEHMNQRYLHYVSDDDYLQFNEHGLYREVIRGGAFEFMCGAYMVEACANEHDKPCIVDYVAITSFREPAKRFATTVRNDGTVHKIPLHREGMAAISKMKEIYDDLVSLGVCVLEVNLQNNKLVMQRVDLPVLCDYWASKFSKGVFDESEMIAHFDRIRESIYKASEKGKCYWELVPANCFYDEINDDIIYFDQEYYSENISPDIALTRAILAFDYSPVFHGKPYSKAWMNKLRERYNLTENWDALVADAHDKTWNEVVGDGYKPLIEETIKAAQRVDENRKAQISER